jgi:hypothetical protein
MAVFCVCIGLCLTAELFRLAAGYLEKPQVTKGLLLLAWPAPKSRFVVTGLAWRKSKIRNQNRIKNRNKPMPPQKLKYEAR